MEKYSEGIPGYYSSIWPAILMILVTVGVFIFCAIVVITK